MPETEGYSKPTVKTYRRDFNVDADELARCVKACHECAQACVACADDCLGEQDVAGLVKCIRLTQNCADICVATGRVANRQTVYDAQVTAAILDACVRACASCGDECAAHADKHDHCRVCAEACRRCEDACRRLLEAIA